MITELTIVSPIITAKSLKRVALGMRAGSLLVGDGRKTAEAALRGGEDPARDALPAPAPGRGRREALPS